jgi:hypothetical protein
MTNDANAERWKTIRFVVSRGWGTTLRYALIASIVPIVTTAGVLLVNVLK